MDKHRTLQQSSETQRLMMKDNDAYIVCLKSDEIRISSGSLHTDTQVQLIA